MKMFTGKVSLSISINLAVADDHSFNLWMLPLISAVIINGAPVRKQPSVWQRLSRVVREGLSAIAEAIQTELMGISILFNSVIWAVVR